MPGATHYNGFVDAFRKTYARDGVRGFYRGLVPTMLKVVPSTSISYAVFGILKDRLMKFRNDSYSEHNCDCHSSSYYSLHCLLCQAIHNISSTFEELLPIWAQQGRQFVCNPLSSCSFTGEDRNYMLTCRMNYQPEQ